MSIIIDRFEGDSAVCEGGGKLFILPRILLPAEAKEGDCLKLSLDQKTIADRHTKIQVLENKLFRQK